MGETRLFLLLLAFQFLLLGLVSMPAWRASGSPRLSTVAGSGSLLLLLGVALLATQGTLPELIVRVVAPCLLLAGVRLIYEAAYDLCAVPAPPRWERALLVAGGCSLVVLWLMDRSPDGVRLARARFLSIAIPAGVTIACWLQRLRTAVPRPWSLGTRYVAWAAVLGMVAAVLRILAVLSMRAPIDPLHSEFAPLAIAGTLPVSLLITVGLILQVEARAREQLRLANAQLTRDAETDALTGVGNRRRFESAAASELPRARHNNWPMTVMLLDLDHFKGINDRWGHQAGDAVLREVAQHCARALRSSDVIARWGGEEFAMLLPKCSLKTAESVASRIVESVRAMSVKEIGGERCTVSIGIAAVEPGESTLNPALQRADGALYAAKSAGRNRHYVGGVMPNEQARSDTGLTPST